MSEGMHVGDDMTDNTPDPSTFKYPLQHLKRPPHEGATREMAAHLGLGAIQSRADLDSAKSAAGLLTPEGMQELRMWIDVQLFRREGW